MENSFRSEFLLNLVKNPILLAALPLIPLIFLLLKITKPNSTSNRLPSPPKIPLIGNLHQIGLLPHRSLFQLSKKHGTLMLLQAGRIPTLVISSSSTAQQIMRDHDLVFANRPSVKASRFLLYNNYDIVFSPFGERWRQIRKICVTNLLSSKMVHSFSVLRMEEVSSMIQTISRTSSTNRNGVVCLSEILNSFTCDVLCRSVLGSSISEEKRGILCDLIHQNVVLFVKFFFEDYFPWLRWVDVVFGWEGKLKKQSVKWNSFLEELIEEHKCRLKEEQKQTSGDFLGILLRLQKDSSLPFVLTNEHIKAILLDMIAAGTDTTFAALDWTMFELIRNPKVMEKVQDEVRRVAHGEELIREEQLGNLSYMKAVIKEVLRLHPPAPLLLPRESLRDCRIEEHYKIPKETRVMINAWAIGRDEVYWKEAEEFKPERFLNGDWDYKGHDFHYIPFGAGRRICPGIQFAIATIELALANLLNRFDWKLPNGISCDGMDMQEIVGLVASRKEKLELVPIDVQFT